MSVPASAEAAGLGGADELIVAADALAAWQWEAHLSDAGGAAAWSTHAAGYGYWTRELWAAESGMVERAGLLTPRQSEALWRRVVAESAEGGALLGVAGTAAWAEDARRRIEAWRLDGVLRPARAHEHDYAAFLRWSRSYAERLRDAGWIDDARLDAELAGSARQLSIGRIVLADLAELTPARRLLTQRLEEAGWTMMRRESPSAAAGPAKRCECADPRGELQAAAEWARTVLRSRPGARVVIVVPDLDRRGREVRRTLVDGLAATEGHDDGPVPVHVTGDEPSAGHAYPLAGAAMNALEMLSRAGSSADFGRWLRSPFFHSPDAESTARRAALDIALRSHIRAQLPFVVEWRRGGLREHVLADEPDAAARVDEALLELEGARERQTPAAWAALWPRLLQRLGWRGWSQPSQDGDGEGEGGDVHAEQRHWESALQDFSMLTAVTGAVTADQALAELDASLRRTRPRPARPLEGIHVVGGITGIGPGYAGAWVAGATDAALPVGIELNPLLPRSLQVEAGMPRSSPQEALQRSRVLVREAIRRVPECVFSWPARDGEQINAPSPLLAGIAAADLPVAARAAPGKGRGRSGTQHGAAVGTAPPGSATLSRMETVADPAPPLSGSELRGGVAALNAQSACPLRAFCEYRLGAKPLEPFVRGVPARARGIATHDALERFFRHYGSRAKLESAAGRQRYEHAARCAEAALAKHFGSARHDLGQLFALERDRLTELIVALAGRELERGEFCVDELEKPRSLELRGRTLALRIDRVDRLEDGGFAVIDYKTGRGVQTSSWSWPRPRDVQLPAYALASRNVTALVVASLRAGEVRYAGLWPKRAFPGRTQANGGGMDVPQLIGIWQQSLGGLVDEYASGDTRFFVGDPEPAAGTFAPLTRVPEQLALYRRARAREQERQ